MEDGESAFNFKLRRFYKKYVSMFATYLCRYKHIAQRSVDIGNHVELIQPGLTDTLSGIKDFR